MSATAPKRPQGDGWRIAMTKKEMPLLAVDVWMHESGVAAIAAIETVDDTVSGILAPHHHVSATFRSRTPRACTDQEMELVRSAFGMGRAEEDNHGPGIARHLWLMVGRDAEPECPCKQDEERIVEGDRVRFEEASHAGQ